MLPRFSLRRGACSAGLQARSTACLAPSAHSASAGGMKHKSELLKVCLWILLCVGQQVEPESLGGARRAARRKFGHKRLWQPF